MSFEIMKANQQKCVVIEFSFWGKLLIYSLFQFVLLGRCVLLFPSHQYRWRIEEVFSSFFCFLHFLEPGPQKKMHSRPNYVDRVQFLIIQATPVSNSGVSPSTGAIKALSPLVSALIEVILKDPMLILFLDTSQVFALRFVLLATQKSQVCAGQLYDELAADILEGKRKCTLIQLASDVKVKDRRPVAIQYANNTTT